VRVVAVFSGGGAKALAHVGAFRALEEAGLAPAHIVGTSMGAVVGAALASGVSWKGVRGAALALSPDEVAPLDLLALVTGVFSSNLLRPEFLERMIERLVTPRSFAELRIPLTVTATDLDTGALTLFGAGGREHVPLHQALFASCALPLYYPPITIATRRYADGGLRAVLPLEVARTITGGPVDRVVAVHVGPGFDETLPAGAEPDRRIPPLVRAHGEAIRIMMAAQVERDIAAWPGDAPRLVLVRPVREKEATFKIQEAERYIEAGYRATREVLALREAGSGKREA
jgi:NTE family protein